MTVELKPLHWKMIVEHDEPAKQTSGGIILPKGHKDTMVKATIIAIGPGKYDDTLDMYIETRLKPGDRILINKNIGETIKMNGKEYKLAREIDAVCLIQEE